MTLICRRPTGVSRYGAEVFGDVCSRIRFHPGECRTHTTATRIRSYYDINREYWPDLRRPRALYSAIRMWWMCRNP